MILNLEWVQVHGQDLDKAEVLSSAVQSGMVTVNNVVFSDPRVPFGGVKNSGYGRESSRFGMLEFKHQVGKGLRSTNL